MSITCSNCTQFIVKKIPEGDTHERDVCTKCNQIFYQNPKIVTGLIPLYKDKILLCKRNIEPRKNFWTVPSGFMEMNETLKEAALREANEEAGIHAKIDHLHTIYDLPHIGQVYFLFLANCDSMSHSPGIETIESKWIHYNDIPWEEIAFSSVAFGLKRLHQPGPHYGQYNA
ncbi:MAG: NUDIX hydrolase [Candidatus Margulisiibacteriota bacterium]